jgi:small GTP-binding protein
MLRPILSEAQTSILTDERRWLGDLRVALARFDMTPEDQATLERSVHQLDELFLLVVVGEFNAGKSALINALLGQPLLEEGVTPTTSRIHLIKYAPSVERAVVDPATQVVTAPVQLLREINIVDTPGTNAIQRQHEAITQEFVPRADIVLFVTSADRPFTESERAFLERIRQWGKKVVVVLNKIDILENPDEVTKIEAFIGENMRVLLGFTPEVFPVSARLALRAKQAGAAAPGDAHPDASRFQALEQYIVATLDETERIRLKLLNPLGVGTHMAGRYLGILEQRLNLLKDDLITIQDIESQLSVYQQDVTRDFRYRLADVDNVLHEFEQRGIDFFDETMHLGRIFDLINKHKLKADYQRRVVADVPQVIERRVSDVIDWLVSHELHQWQAVVDHLARRQAAHAGRIVGQVGGSFDYDRARLLETVGGAAQEAMQGYDREHEAARMAESVRMAVAGTALAEVSAIGLGALVTMIATTTLADVSGLLAASTVAVLGLFVIPMRRRQAKLELRQKIAAVRQQLMGGMTAQFQQELERSLARIHQAVAPYTRFVRAERDRLLNNQTEVAAIRAELARLQATIEAM